MKVKLFALMIAMFVGFGFAYADNSETYVSSKVEIAGDDEVLTAERQAKLTPKSVLKDLMKGNERYMKNELTERDLPSQVAQTAAGQYPKAVILSCLDSRVPVEYVFDQGVGDVFTARVAGNFVNEDILGSMEFGAKVAGSKLILVLGHEECGAIKATIDDVRLGNITPMLEKLQPAVRASEGFEGEKTSKNPEYVAHVCENNVMLTIDNIRQRSPILKEMEDNGEIMIVGAVYDLDSGKVTLMD
jgi:carbonic anhydrase